MRREYVCRQADIGEVGANGIGEWIESD